MWENVLWFVETKAELLGHNSNKYVWCQKNTKAIVKHGSGSVMLWWCFPSAGTGVVIKVEGILNRSLYQSKLVQNLQTLTKTKKRGISPFSTRTQSIPPNQQKNDPARAWTWIQLKICKVTWRGLCTGDLTTQVWSASKGRQSIPRQAVPCWKTPTPKHWVLS